MKNKKAWKKAFFAAFPHTVPILTGFLVLGTAYGMFAVLSGLDAWVPILMSIAVFGGSLEFVAVTLLTSPFAPLSAFLMALMIQARHLFYGLSMLEKYRGTGKKKFYLIFALCDETFSVNCTAEIPSDVDSDKFYFCISLLDQFYWVLGAALGSLLGGWISLPTEGLSFVMTAMFVVIFLNQWLKEKNHFPSLLGLGSALICLLIFGKSNFLLPALACIFACLLLFRKPTEKTFLSGEERDGQ